VLVVHGTLAIPLPTKVSDNAFKGKYAQEELQRWSDILADVGVDIEPQDLGDRVIDFGQRFAGTKKAFLTPFRPVLRTTGTGQAWGLFTYPNVRPNRMHVSVREDQSSEWRPIYVALSEEYDWHEQHFRYRKVRGVYDDNAFKVRASYDNFCHWVAGDVFEEMPEVLQVRVHMVQTNTTLPGEELDDSEKVRLVRVMKREDFE